MISIKVLGSGCAKCKSAMAVIGQVAEDKGVAIELEKVEDPSQIMAYGVMSTPAVVVNEQLVHKGSVPRPEDVESWLVCGK